MKKRSFTAKLSILLSVLSVIFLILAVVSSVWRVKDTIAAIDKIGAVEYSDAVRVRIDSANEKYETLDKSLHLQDGVSNSSQLLYAKCEYARLAIVEAYLAAQNGEPDQTVLALVQDAQEILSAYFAEDEYDLVSNYADLEAVIEGIEADGSAGAGDQPGESGDSDEEIEIC